MSIENIQQSLLQEGKKEETRITGEGRKEAETIMVNAREQAKAIKAEEKRKAEELVENERRERISAAKLKAKKIVNEARNKLVDSALGEIWEEFREFPKQKEYAGFMKKIIMEAENELGKGTVMVSAEDLALAKKHSKNAVKSGEPITGGAIIATKDGKIIIDNSLEAIFGNNKEEIKGIIFRETVK